MSTKDILVSKTDMALESAPIHPDWILEGAPRARNCQLARSNDGAATTLIWDCTAGKFNWFYDVDETIHILEGGMTITDESGTRRVGPGEVVFFPAGSKATWHVETYVRKVAVLHDPVPRLLSQVLRAIRRMRSPVSAHGAPPFRRQRKSFASAGAFGHDLVTGSGLK